MKHFAFDKPPLMEARCDVDFMGGESWNLTIPGRFYERIRTVYPEQKAPQFGEKPSPEELFAAMGNSLELRDKGGSKIVRISRRGLSVVQKLPYLGWETFRADIGYVLANYLEVIQPEGIDDLGLRYINVIPTPEEPHHYDELLTIHPTLPPGQRDLPWYSWAQRVDVWREDLSGLFVFQTGTTNVGMEISGIDGDEAEGDLVVDLSMRRYIQESIQQEEALSWLEVAHEEIEKIFLQSLTDLTKPMVGYREGEKKHETNS